MSPPVNLRICDSALDPDGDAKVILHRKLRDGGSEHYRVFLYLEGPDLPLVDQVTYELHHTFKKRRRDVRRSIGNPNCQLEIWTWGLFTVRARVRMKDRSFHELTHELGYDRDFDREDVGFERA